MNTYTLSHVDRDGIAVISVTGYFSVPTGKELHALVDDLVRGGCTRYIVDFSECKLINSPGMVLMMELAMKIIDDHRGALVLTGLDTFKVSVFTMTGVLPLATVFPTVADALKKLS